MMFTIEFFCIRKEDNARAMLDRITHIASDLESAKIKAKSLFDTLNMPQNPMACGFWTRMGTRCSFGRRGRRVPRDPDGGESPQPINYLDFAGLRKPPCKFSARHSLCARLFSVRLVRTYFLIPDRYDKGCGVFVALSPQLLGYRDGANRNFH